MDNVHAFLVDIWVGFLGLFLTFYVVLDGFDLGIGVLSLFVREGERRGIMMASLSSVWDANETWLVVLGGALFGAFTSVYGIVMQAFYLPLIAMIFALGFRGVAFEFREHSRRPRVWEIAFGVGSLTATLCQGFVLGGLIAGPRVRDGQFVGHPFDWLSPFSVLAALGVVFGYVLLGATYLIIKTTGEQLRRAVHIAWIAGALMLIAAAGVSVWTPIRYSFVAAKWFGGGIDFRFAVPPAFRGIWGRRSAGLIDRIACARTWPERFQILDEAFHGETRSLCVAPKIDHGWPELATRPCCLRECLLPSSA